MPRPKRKTGITSFNAPAIRLRANAREKITLMLGIDTRNATGLKLMDEAFRQIEKWIGFYKKAIIVSAQLPGIADYKKELSSIERATSRYLEKLHSYPKWVRDEVDKHAGNVNRVEKNLTILVDASTTAASKYAKKESRGRKKNESRLKFIQELKKIFTKYSVKGEHDLSIAKVKSERKDAEVNFVKTVFKDAGEPVPKTLTRMLRAR